MSPLEKDFDFEFPSIYKQLEQDGMLDWNKGWNEPWTAERNWSTEIFPSLKDNPPLLLYTRDFELWPNNKISDSLKNIPSHWDDRHKFIPIGKNGAGDWYAFYLNLKDHSGNIPLVYLQHDLNEAIVLSKNFDDFIFRMMAEVANIIFDSASGIPFQTWFSQNETEYRTRLLAMLESHRKYLSTTRAGIITDIYSKPAVHLAGYKEAPHSRPFDAIAILYDDELSQILKEEIAFPYLDYVFPYQKEM